MEEKPMYPDRSCLTIDLNQAKTNCRIIQERLAPGRRIMAVVKADAYGHGDVQIARALTEIGIRDFAVSNIDEALRLREHGIPGQILILGYTDPSLAAELILNDITQAILSEEYARALHEAGGEQVRCHIALDTGMRRIGLNADDPAACERAIRELAKTLKVTGLFTHLCVADSEEEDDLLFTHEQIMKYQAVADRVRDLHLETVHCLNSAGGLWHSAESDVMRLGIVLYGLKPDYLNHLPEGIRPVLTWKSVVSMVKTIAPGDCVGYGRTFTAQKPMRIATIPTGYADGYRRDLSNHGWVLIHGKRAPIVGRVCMDQMTVDVTQIPEVRLGTEAVLLGRSGEEEFTADDMAHLIGTIGYEIVCGISKRVKRQYQ